MKNQVVQLQVSSKLERFVRPAVVVPKSFFARVALWLLSKTKHSVEATISKESFSYETIPVSEFDDFIQSIAQGSFLRMAFNCEIDRMVCGRDVYERIIQQQRSRDVLFGFDRPMSIRYDNDVKICGIRVQVVPWIEGWAIIPKDNA